MRSPGLVSVLRVLLIAGLSVTPAGGSTAAVDPPAAPTTLLIPREGSDTPIYDTDPEKVVHIINWKDYIDPLVLERFTQETGIQVDYDILESNDSLDAKLRAGRSGYDVVFPSGKYLQAQIELGLYQKLDKSRMRNLDNLDPSIAAKLARFDRGNAHAVDYMFGTVGLAYNAEAVKAAMPNAPLNSLAMIWDPQVVSQFSRCGVAVMDAPSEVVGTALIYLGKDPNSEKLEDLAAAEKLMLAARPFIRLVDSDYVSELASGEICLGLDWSGDTLQASVYAWNERKPFTVGYSLPREGALMFLDTMAIPADAPHVKNAHIFIDYLLRNDASTANSRFISFPNGNSLSWLLTGEAVFDDKNFFPPPSMQERLVPDLPESEEFDRQLQRTWARFLAAGKQR